jgi:integrase
MASKSRNLYQRGAVWWGRVKVAGREYRGSLRTTDPREARDRLKAWRRKLERQAIGIEDAATFKEAVVRWAQEVLPGAVKPAVAKRYLSSVGQLADTFGAMRVDQIDARAIAAYVSSRSGKVTNATIRRDLTALSRLLAACVSWGWRTDNPARVYDRSMVRERREPIRPPDPAAVSTLVSAAPAGMGLVLRLLEQTGMREAEAVNLAGDDVDWERRQIRLLKTKTSRPRALAWQTPGGDASPVLTAARRHGPLFRADTGKPYRNFSSNVRRVMLACQKADKAFRPFRVHDLRHGFAIRWLKAGGDIYALSRHLGHSSVKTTEGYLAYLTEEERQKVAQMGAQRLVEPEPEKR